jgi:hypothetical protein
MPGRARRGKGRRARRWGGAALVVLVLVASGTLFSGTSYAVGDSTDPNATGCAGSASTPRDRSISFDGHVGGYLELRWSSNTQTVWAWFTCHVFALGCTDYRLYAHRNTDGAESGVTVTAPSRTRDGDQLYTRQLNDGVGVSAKACVQNIRFPDTAPYCTASF